LVCFICFTRCVFVAFLMLIAAQLAAVEFFVNCHLLLCLPYCCSCWLILWFCCCCCCCCCFLLSFKAVAGHGDDKPTEELLLLSLCSFAVAHTSNTTDMDSILVQLVGPQLEAAANQLTAALHGNWPELQQAGQQQQQQPVVSLPYGNQQPGRQQEPGTQQVPTSSVSCFRALANLVAGLPTGEDCAVTNKRGMTLNRPQQSDVCFAWKAFHNPDPSLLCLKVLCQWSVWSRAAVDPADTS
jgi:hypothetical protein